MIRPLLTAAAGAVRAVRVALPHAGADTATDHPGDPAPMATRQSTTYVDDLDDTVEAEETVSFGLDGTSYEIDLSAEHAASLRDDVATWVEHARRTSRTRKTSPTRATARATAGSAGAGRASTDRDRAGSVREWARANGHEVSDRGRIPAAVQEAFDAAH